MNFRTLLSACKIPSENRALLNEYRDLLSGHRALLIEYRDLLNGHRALLMEYRVFGVNTGLC